MMLLIVLLDDQKNVININIGNYLSITYYFCSIWMRRGTLDQNGLLR